MIKRIIAGAAATGLALSLMTAGGANAASCTSDGTHPPAHTPAPGTNQPFPTGTLYADGGAGGGYIGVKGDHGWLEAGGAPSASGGYVRGASNPSAVEGELKVGSAPTVCVNGTRKP